MTKKTLTLIELIIAVILVSALILVISAVSMFFIKQVAMNIERYNIYSQINYTFEDMKIRSISAIDINPHLSSGGQTSTLGIKGESDIYDITPDDTSDNLWYTYQVDNADLVLADESGRRDVLVDGRYTPEITFQHNCNGICDEPNVLTVTIVATSPKYPDVNISKTEGLRLWFVDAVQ